MSKVFCRPAAQAGAVILVLLVVARVLELVLP